MDDKEKLYLFFNEYASFMEEMESVQKEKLESIIAKDLSRMERSIKVQQAYAMRLDNIENRRILLQKEAGLDGLSFSEIISRAPEDRKNGLRLLFERIGGSVNYIGYLNSKASELARINLRSTEEALSGPEGHRIDTKV